MKWLKEYTQLVIAILAFILLSVWIISCVQDNDNVIIEDEHPEEKVKQEPSNRDYTLSYPWFPQV